MNGYASSTYMWENAADKKLWVKYHFKSEQGVQRPVARPQIRIAFYALLGASWVG